MKDLVNSTPASRINGYVGGNGSLAELEKEIESFGLPSHLATKLRDIVASKDHSSGHCQL